MRTYLFGLLLALLIVAGSNTAFAAGTSTVSVASTTLSVATGTLPVATTTTATNTPVAITRAESERQVRAYFADIPAMIEVARCESNFRQFTDSGNIFYDASGDMVGVFQFNWVMHKAQAEIYGFDITTLDGNLKYARHLYNAQGITPWASCAPAPTTPVLDATTELKIKLLKQVILLLQQLLAMQYPAR